MEGCPGTTFGVTPLTFGTIEDCLVAGWSVIALKLLATTKQVAPCVAPWLNSPWQCNPSVGPPEKLGE
jgi:hypothetical protein